MLTLLLPPVLNRQLVKAGFQCDVADNGQVALDRIKELNKLGKRYDQILLDLEMPGEWFQSVKVINHVSVG